eukprot:14354933-Ditylum_brightwellii.AAC.1
MMHCRFIDNPKIGVRCLLMARDGFLESPKCFVNHLLVGGGWLGLQWQVRPHSCELATKPKRRKNCAFGSISGYARARVTSGLRTP